MESCNIFGNANLSTVLFMSTLLRLRDDGDHGIVFLSELDEVDAGVSDGLVIDGESKGRMPGYDTYEIVVDLEEDPDDDALVITTASEKLSELAGREIKMLAVHEDGDPEDVLGLAMFVIGPDGQPWNVDVPIF